MPPDAPSTSPTGRPTSSFRKRCIEQLQAALESEREEYREELVAEVGTPRMLTFAAQLDWPLEDALLYPAAQIDEVRVGAATAKVGEDGHGVAPKRPEGAHGRRRCRGALELPGGGDAQQAWRDSGHGQYRGPQAGPRHAVECHPARSSGRRKDGHSGGRAQRRDLRQITWLARS